MSAMPPRLTETADGTFALSPFLERTWTLRITNLWGDQVARREWIREVRAPSTVEIEMIYRIPHEAFDRSATLKRVRTATDFASAAKYVRKELRAGGVHTAERIEGAILHTFGIDGAREGGQTGAVMLEVAGIDRWVLLSGAGIAVVKVSA
jgi:hypothetical protein